MKELKEILAELKEEGYEVTERKFLYFRSLGLLPPPVRRGMGRGRGVKRLYPKWIPNRVKFLLRWKGYWEDLRSILSQDLGRITFEGEERRIVLQGPLYSLDGKRYLTFLLEDGSLVLKEAKNEEELV